MSRPWVSSLLGLAALVLLLWGGANCNFIKFESTTTVAGQGVEPTTLNFGLWSYARYVIVQSGGYVTAGKVCMLYPENMRPDDDAYWEVARIIMGILWVVAVGMLVFACCTACCSKELDTLHRGAPPLVYMLFCILSGLLFLVLDSNLCKNNRLVQSLNVDGKVTSVEFPETCSLGTGGILVAIATALWGLAGVLSVMAQRKTSKSTEANEALTEALISDDV
mmetsp:Transcript_1687/g.3720  ORF Transcript_1687/g.3720 Transcript_1687/m.3720 type:complete len:222 (+) Transcript_1687:52-717(+)